MKGQTFIQFVILDP